MEKIVCFMAWKVKKGNAKSEPIITATTWNKLQKKILKSKKGMT